MQYKIRLQATVIGGDEEEEEVAAAERPMRKRTGTHVQQPHSFEGMCKICYCSFLSLYNFHLVDMELREGKNMLINLKAMFANERII